MDFEGDLFSVFEQKPDDDDDNISIKPTKKRTIEPDNDSSSKKQKIVEPGAEDDEITPLKKTKTDDRLLFIRCLICTSGILKCELSGH